MDSSDCNLKRVLEAIESGGGEVSALLAAGASPNSYAELPGAALTPLHLAVFRCLPQAVEALLEGGAHPNAEVLACAQDGPYSTLVGMTATDLAVALDADALVALLVRCGGRPGRSSHPEAGCHSPTLRRELDRARAVGAAESLVAEAVLLPLVKRAQEERRWDEADRLLGCILRHEGESEHSQHARIRGLLARGLADEAMEEASLVFLRYRDQGRYLQALQVVRCMRLIAPDSGRPYELELEFLASLGRMEEARLCLDQLAQVYDAGGDAREVSSCRARFEILRRRPKRRQQSRLPRSWTVAQAPGPGSSANLPAVVEQECDLAAERERLRRLWWGS